MSSGRHGPPVDETPLSSAGPSALLISAEEYPALAELISYANDVTRSLERLGLTVEDDDSAVAGGPSAGR